MNQAYRDSATEENPIKSFSEDLGINEIDYREYLALQNEIQARAEIKRKEREAEDAYNTELSILKAESQQRNWFQNLAQGAYVSSKFDNYVEMPDGTLVIDDNYLPGLSSDINLTKGTYGDGWKKATPAEKKEYETYKKRLIAGYHESPGFRLGAASEELGDTIIDGIVDMALDLPLIFETAGSPLLRREFGLSIEDMILSKDEVEGKMFPENKELQQRLTARRVSLTNKQNQLQKEKQDTFDKMSEEEKISYLNSNGRWDYTMGRMNDISRSDKQKEIRSQILQKAAELEGRDVKRFFNPNEVDPISEEMISWQKSYVDADGVTRYQDEQVRYEIPGADGNPWNAKQLVRNSDGTPALDNEGNYIYKDKYSLAAK